MFLEIENSWLRVHVSVLPFHEKKKFTDFDCSWQKQFNRTEHISYFFFHLNPHEIIATVKCIISHCYACSFQFSFSASNRININFKRKIKVLIMMLQADNFSLKKFDFVWGNFCSFSSFILFYRAVRFVNIQLYLHNSKQQMFVDLPWEFSQTFTCIKSNLALLPPTPSTSLSTPSRWRKLLFSIFIWQSSALGHGEESFSKPKKVCAGEKYPEKEGARRYFCGAAQWKCK